jgi:hypothetical protein
MESTTHRRKPTPLPKFQLFIVFLIQFAEPVTALVVYPFVNQFVRDTGITKGDETKTGYYAGMIVCCSLLDELIFVDDSVPGIYFLFGGVFDGHSVGIPVRSVWSQTSSSNRTLGIIDFDADVRVVYQVLASCLFPLFAGNFQR